ncbi:MAG: 4Fe-4S dicluster domain-containing protein [Firmicutes bacterium]|nr:4Fe-4S dicluster domain-containing protein [Bacillota bacterium]
MSQKISRREFLKRSTAAAAASAAVACGLPAKAEASTDIGEVGIVIDLTLCDGCNECTLACQREHGHPENPNPEGLTPENFLYVQHVTVETEDGQEEVHVPRKCMHCDDPACARLCPFSVNQKTPEGPVVIDEDYCLGGQKCKAVCPWHIPQRKTGVGFYLKLQPLPFGAGVMYKCDGCIDRIRAGKAPACVEACPKGAIKFGEKEAMREYAHQRAEEIGGYIYGEKEAGGTSTFYVSKVPFEKIDEALAAKNEHPRMPVAAKNVLDSPNGMAQALLLAPVAGVFAAGIAAHKKWKEEGENNG